MERNACVQAQRRVADAVSLRLAELLIRQVGLVAYNWPAEVPEMNADLVGAPGDRLGRDERRAVGEPL